MTKREVLQEMTFGKRTAEEEAADLASYFVETDQWRRISAGEVDVVYGPKGSGKSAIYSLLLNRADQLLERGIIVASAENPRGAPVFKDLIEDPPTSESQFRALWKLYFLTLVGRSLRDRDVVSGPAKQALQSLEDAGPPAHGVFQPQGARASRS
jgi:hypothetical protein